LGDGGAETETIAVVNQSGGRAPCLTVIPAKAGIQGFTAAGL